MPLSSSLSLSLAIALASSSSLSLALALSSSLALALSSSLAFSSAASSFFEVSIPKNPFILSVVETVPSSTGGSTGGGVGAAGASVSGVESPKPNVSFNLSKTVGSLLSGVPFSEGGDGAGTGGAGTGGAGTGGAAPADLFFSSSDGAKKSNIAPPF